MPTRIILITNPAHDKATEYLSSWSDGIRASIANLPTNTNIYELKRSDAIKDKLTKLVLEKNPHLILFNGHGGSKIILGFESNILISCDDNEALLEDRIIHSLSCDSGKELGPACITLGTKAFIGYKKEFKFAHLGETTSTLQYNDPLANLFLRPAFEISKALLEGNTVKQAHERSQKMYLDNLQLLLTSPDPNLHTIYAGRVYHNMINQVSLGDQNVSF